jgi:hypothetical protein
MEHIRILVRQFGNDDRRAIDVFPDVVHDVARTKDVIGAHTANSE